MSSKSSHGGKMIYADEKIGCWLSPHDRKAKTHREARKRMAKASRKVNRRK